MTLEYRKALTEVNVIIHYMHPKYLKKLPQKFINFINKNMDNEYVPNIDKNVPIDEQELKKDTKVLLSLLYRKYWCNAEQKKLFNEEDVSLSENGEKEQREKYKYENLFKDKKEQISSKQIENPSSEMLIEYGELKWYKKIFNKIVNFFKIKK